MQSFFFYVFRIEFSYYLFAFKTVFKSKLATFLYTFKFNFVCKAIEWKMLLFENHAIELLFSVFA